MHTNLDELCYQLDKNTTIVEHPAAGTARAYVDGHPLVRLTKTYVTLDTGGIFNRKTLASIKNTAYHFGLCLVIHKRNGVWYVETPSKEVKPFTRRVGFSRDFDPKDAPPERDPTLLTFTYKKDIDVNINQNTGAIDATWHRSPLVSVGDSWVTLNFTQPMDSGIKRRMNYVSGALGLHFRVYAEQSKWLVDTPDAEIRPLTPGMTFFKRKIKDPHQIIHDLQK